VSPPASALRVIFPKHTPADPAAIRRNAFTLYKSVLTVSTAVVPFKITISSFCTNADVKYVIHTACAFAYAE
jgi:hypothetical protein